MSQPNFKEAQNFALQRLSVGLPPYIYYHNIRHTRDDVVPAAARLAHEEGVYGEPLTLLMTAAWFHDLGFTVQSKNHELLSIAIARDFLPHWNYTPAQIEVIAGIILATKLPQEPHNLLEQIMADADLDSLGRDDFFELSLDLRRELAATGNIYTDIDWYTHQIEFMYAHSYFTRSARWLRQIQKEQHLEILIERVNTMMDAGVV